MKLSEKSLFLGITGVIILAILAVFYTFGYQNHGESDLSSGNFPAASFLNKENSKGVVFCGSSDCAGDAKPGEYIDASSQNSIFFEETITFENFFEKSGEVLKNLAPFLNSAPESRKDTESFTFFGYTYLSDKEIFEKIWPDSYRDELIDLQNLEIVGGELIAGGGISDGFNFDDSSPSDFATDPVEWYIEPEKRVLKFSSDEDIYLAIDVIFEEALESKMITQEEMSKFDEGALVLKKLIDQEKSNLKKGQLKSSATLPGYQNFYQAKNQPSLVVKEILDGFFYTVFMAKPVDAKWVRSPDCYKDDDPSFKPLGMNTRVFCCNCGIKFVRVGKYCIPIFKDDCGEKMSICGLGAGPEYRSDGLIKYSKIIQTRYGILIPGFADAMEIMRISEEVAAEEIIMPIIMEMMEVAIMVEVMAVVVMIAWLVRTANNFNKPTDFSTKNNHNNLLATANPRKAEPRLMTKLMVWVTVERVIPMDLR